MALVQCTRIQDLACRRADEVDLQVLRIQQLQRAVAVIIRVGKSGVRRLSAHGSETLNIAGTPGDDIHGCFWIIEAIRVSSVVVDRLEALRVVLVAEDGDVDAICIEQVLKGSLAGCAGTRTSGVPWPVAGDNEPWSHSPVDAGEIGRQEFELLVRLAKGATVEPRGSAWSVRRAGEISLGVDHGDVRHAVLKRIPEWRLGKTLGLRG